MRMRAFAATLLFALPALAQQGLGDAPLEDGPSVGWMLVRTLVVLGIVVMLVYLTLNVGLRRLIGVRALGVGGGLVTVMERTVLDPKRTVYVLRAGKDYLLVGAGEGGMSLLGKIDPADVEAHEAQRAQASSQMSPFLQKLLSRRGGPPPPSA